MFELEKGQVHVAVRQYVDGKNAFSFVEMNCEKIRRQIPVVSLTPSHRFSGIKRGRRHRPQCYDVADSLHTSAGWELGMIGFTGATHRFEMGNLKSLPIELVPFEKSVDTSSSVAAGHAKVKRMSSF